MAFDKFTPAQSHEARADILKMKNNFLALRNFEAGNNPPASPQAGMLWFDTGNDQLKQRNTDNDAWLVLWDVSTDEVPKKKIDDHIADNITAANTVHGIRQGSGNGLDGDLLDGQEASDFIEVEELNALHPARLFYYNIGGAKQMYFTGSLGYAYVDEAAYWDYSDV